MFFCWHPTLESSSFLGLLIYLFFISDCAEIYGNEAEIGEAFKSAFEEGLVKRYVHNHTSSRLR